MENLKITGMTGINLIYMLPSPQNNVQSRLNLHIL